MAMKNPGKKTKKKSRDLTLLWTEFLKVANDVGLSSQSVELDSLLMGDCECATECDSCGHELAPGEGDTCDYCAAKGVFQVALDRFLDKMV